ncbi:MAG TPA: hypothetical protein VEZ55_12430 [Chitinophagaceae bacterium]|jgi:hypothetical protein|nr:hypothetical protein [Chitinophagaceae bacterium]
MSIQPNDPQRNRPADDGRNNDPNLRDESAAQPGVNTMSGSNTDHFNTETTESVSDYEGTSDFETADLAFDDDPEDE